MSDASASSEDVDLNAPAPSPRKPKMSERLAAAEKDRDGWKAACLIYRRIAADGVLRLRTGMSYAQAQDLYDRAVLAEPE